MVSSLGLLVPITFTTVFFLFFSTFSMLGRVVFVALRGLLWPGCQFLAFTGFTKHFWESNDAHYYLVATGICFVFYSICGALILLGSYVHRVFFAFLVLLILTYWFVEIYMFHRYESFVLIYRLATGSL